MKSYWVYIIKCSDETYYTGVTARLIKRFEEHCQAIHQDSYTAKRRPLDLVFFCEFSYVVTAIAWEKRIKKWSRAKKEALIRGDFKALPNLAKKKF